MFLVVRGNLDIWNISIDFGILVKLSFSFWDIEYVGQFILGYGMLSYHETRPTLDHRICFVALIICTYMYMLQQVAYKRGLSSLSILKGTTWSVNKHQ